MKLFEIQRFFILSNANYFLPPQVELVLPKQICRELLYGYAEKPVHQYEHPKPFLSHGGHVNYGPKVTKRYTPTDTSSETIEAETPKVPESIPSESQE